MFAQEPLVPPPKLPEIPTWAIMAVGVGLVTLVFWATMRR